MLQSYKYGLITTVKNKVFIFWTLVFPIILGTLFNIAFGSIMANTENFEKIPAAIVAENAQNSQNGENAEAEYFLEMIESLSQGENALIVPHYVDMAEAEQLLTDGDIMGIFHFQADNNNGEINLINLIVMRRGINQSILKSISDSFIQTASTVNSIALTRPDMIAQTIENLSREIKINAEISLGRGETDTMVQYFYALLAMACLFGSYFGYYKIAGIQANLSPLAARRCVSPSKKSAMIISEFAAATTVMSAESLIIIAYLTGVLGVNFGDQWGFVILTSFIGSIMGVSLGMFFASFIRGSMNTMYGVLSAVVMLLSFFSGLKIGRAHV
jgi:ABC-2 type transport system permease protein